MSSISKTDNAYWQNDKDLNGYYSALDSGKSPVVKCYFVTEDDKIRREVIMQIMCNLELNFQDLSRKLGLDFASYFEAELDSLDDLEVDELLRRTAAGVQVTELGRLFIRNIAMRFDAYLPQLNEQRFSKTI
jgi:oxygen-independent coproporphyrinogen-3 oxidase